MFILVHFSIATSQVIEGLTRDDVRRFNKHNLLDIINAFFKVDDG